jgi:hypothetical protein
MGGVGVGVKASEASLCAPLLPHAGRRVNRTHSATPILTPRADAPGSLRSPKSRVNSAWTRSRAHSARYTFVCIGSALRRVTFGAAARCSAVYPEASGASLLPLVRPHAGRRVNRV